MLVMAIDYHRTLLSSKTCKVLCCTIFFTIPVLKV